MKIAIIEPDGQGGLAHFAYELGQALAGNSHDVLLVTSKRYELQGLPHGFDVLPVMDLWQGADAKDAQRRQRRWYRLYAATRRLFRGLKLTREWVRATRLLIKLRPDAVIFSEMAHPHLAFAPLFMRRSGMVTAQVCHEFTERDAKSRLLARVLLALSRCMFRQFDRIFFLSEATRQAFLTSVTFPRERTARIPHGSHGLFPKSARTGAALKAELGIGQGEPVVLFFGYIRPSKGVPDLLEAFAASAWRDRARLVVAGHITKFADMRELEEKVRSLGIAHRVELSTAYIPNDLVSAYFDMAQIVVLPYRSASQSGVLHLAYGNACPVVATNVGGLCEDVVDGETGILVPCGDVRSMSRAIDRLLDDPHRARAMGARAKQLADTQFTWSRAASIIAESLESARRDKAGAAPKVRLEAGSAS